jgi:hypothetical protein
MAPREETIELNLKREWDKPDFDIKEYVKI